MEIKVLGGGCAACEKLHETVQDAVKELKIEAEIHYITDMSEIMKAGIMSTPALIVNGKVKVMGRVPKRKEVMQIVSDEFQ